MSRLIFLFASLFGFAPIITCLAQTAIIDSLKKVVHSTPNDNTKLEALLLLCEQRGSMSTDTLFNYAIIAKYLAGKLSNKTALSLAEYEIAFCFAKQERFDTALQLTNRELAIYTSKKQSSVFAKFSVLKARILDRQNKYADALSQLYTVLKNAEEENNISNQLIAKNGIGWIQVEMAQHNEALTWFYSALNSPANSETIIEI
jgi:tetratricopeptide (TPR) repeat protein